MVLELQLHEQVSFTILVTTGSSVTYVESSEFSSGSSP